MHQVVTNLLTRKRQVTLIPNERSDGSGLISSDSYSLRCRASNDMTCYFGIGRATLGKPETKVKALVLLLMTQEPIQAGVNYIKPEERKSAK